jgi:SAM-dependent methyltransferase
VPGFECVSIAIGAENRSPSVKLPSSSKGKNQFMKEGKYIDMSHLAPKTKPCSDGICYSAEACDVYYPEKGNEACYEVEDQSFWFRHRNDCIREMVRKFPPKGNGPIFDVGGGNGFVAKGLLDAGWEVVLVEPGSSGARNAKNRGLQHVICGTTHSAGFKNGSLPAIGVFDVIEHIEDDLVFLRHLWDLLEPGGMLYLSVPAYNFLWSHEDVDARHFRRYSLASLKMKLLEAEFKSVFGTYIFRFLPLPVFLLRTLPYRLGLVREGSALKEVKRDHSQKQGLLGAMIAGSIKSEIISIRAGKSAGFGGSCLVAARK